MDKLVKLSYLNANEAHIVRGLLENYGIQSFLFDDMAVAFVPLVGGVRLMVRESDLAEAQQVIAQEMCDGGYQGDITKNTKVVRKKQVVKA